LKPSLGRARERNPILRVHRNNHMDVGGGVALFKTVRYRTSGHEEEGKTIRPLKVGKGVKKSSLARAKKRKKKDIRVAA